MHFIYLFIYSANYLVSVCLSLFNYKIEKMFSNCYLQCVRQYKLEDKFN